MDADLKNYKDVYELPLEDRHGWIYDQKGNFVFQFIIDNEEIESKFLNVVNGKENLTNPNISFLHENGIIKNNKEQEFILIRGWGNLTGVGGHNLSDKDACNIQDTFANFIVERLNFRQMK